LVGDDWSVTINHSPQFHFSFFMDTWIDDVAEYAWDVVNEMSITPAFVDDNSDVDKMNEIRELVDFVTGLGDDDVGPVSTIDIHSAYATVDLNDVVNSVVSPRTAKTYTPQKYSTKVIYTDIEPAELTESDDGGGSDYEDKPPPKKKARRAPKKKAHLAPNVEDFLLCFVRGAISTSPVKWTLESMRNMADGLKICPNFLEASSPHFTRDENDVFHPSAQLVKSLGKKAKKLKKAKKQ